MDGVDGFAGKREARGPIAGAVDVLDSEAHNEGARGTVQGEEGGVQTTRSWYSERRRIGGLGGVVAQEHDEVVDRRGATEAKVGD